MRSLQWCGSHTGLMWFTDIHARRQSPPFASTVTGDQEIDVAEVFRVEALLLRAPANVRCEKLAVILIKQKTDTANHSYVFVLAF